jgi:hypothetical protein
VVEHYLDTVGVRGSKPLPRTIFLCLADVSAYIVYKSRVHRDRVNAKVMKDKRLTMPKKIPFDVKRMLYGGFKVMVDA